jgi:hypothetical protein
LVRAIYLDETGHSFKEPIAAVAGVILDPDKQWRSLADEIEKLKDKIPAEFREGFIFHAADLFYGGKYRDRWPDDDRWSLLEELLAVPRKLSIPLVAGCSKKPPKADREEPHTDSLIIHSMAYMLCLKAADEFMVRAAPPDEVAMVIAEERNEAREALRAAHRLVLDKALVEKFLPEFTHMFPISRIKAPPAFASKDADGRCLCLDFSAIYKGRRAIRALSCSRIWGNRLSCQSWQDAHRCSQLLLLSLDWRWKILEIDAQNSLVIHLHQASERSL